MRLSNSAGALWGKKKRSALGDLADHREDDVLTDLSHGHLAQPDGPSAALWHRHALYSYEPTQVKALYRI